LRTDHLIFLAIFLGVMITSRSCTDPIWAKRRRRNSFEDLMSGARMVQLAGMAHKEEAPTMRAKKLAQKHLDSGVS
jgi:hypothetical protein